MYRTEQISDETYENIKTLYKSCFGTVRSLKYIAIKYDTISFGLKNIGFFAISESSEIAAYYGVFPLVLDYEKEDLIIAQSGDTMTAPNHRKKGLFTKLAKETYKLSKENGIKMIFGFPNKNSLPGFERKLDWQFHGIMQRFTLKVNTIPLCEFTSKFPILKPFYNKFVRRQLSEHLVKAEEIKYKEFNFSKVKGNIKKNKVFFDYKLKNENSFVIKINGIQLLIKTYTHLYIGEVCKFEINQLDDFIKSLKKLSIKIGCSKIVFTVSKNHWLFNILKTKAKSQDSLPIGFYLMSKHINPEEIQFSNADYDTF